MWILTSTQFHNKEQPVDEAKYSFYWLLISRSDRISVGTDAAEMDTGEMERKHTVALIQTQQNAAGHVRNFMLLLGATISGCS